MQRGSAEPAPADARGDARSCLAVKHSQILREAGGVLQQHHQGRRAHPGHQQRLCAPAAGARIPLPSAFRCSGWKNPGAPSWPVFPAGKAGQGLRGCRGAGALWDPTASAALPIPPWQGGTRRDGKGPGAAGCAIRAPSEGRDCPGALCPWQATMATHSPARVPAGRVRIQDREDSPALGVSLSGFHVLRRISGFCLFPTKMLQSN